MFILGLLFFLVACSQPIQGETLITSTQELIEPPATPEVSMTPIINPTPTNTFTSEPVEVSTPAIPSITYSSPLVDYSIDELIDMISNLYNPPKPGSDDPHQGVDFSIVDPKLGYAIKGSTVQVILSGEVVMVMNDRFPYGNSILIETPFESLPSSWKDFIGKLPSPALFEVKQALTCPEGWDKSQNGNHDLSLFILYAHLDEVVEWEVGDQILNGEVIGAIGNSGNVLAPHLHIEMRYGDSESLTGSMAHYHVTASEDEMAIYCRWRVSGWYRLVDPMGLLLLDP